jgi:hypothetical protein
MTKEELEVLPMHHMDILKSSRSYKACIRSNELSYEYSVYQKDYEILMKAFQIASIFLTGYCSFIILKYPELQSHPYRAIAYMMLIDCGNFI